MINGSCVCGMVWWCVCVQKNKNKAKKGKEKKNRKGKWKKESRIKRKQGSSKMGKVRSRVSICGVCVE